MRWLSLFALISLCGVSEIAAQTAAETAGGFTGLKEGRTVVVIDESGAETRGRLRSFTADALVVTQEGQELVFERRQVVEVYERGDSQIHYGAIAGGAAGAGLGALLGALDECWYGEECYRGTAVKWGAFLGGSIGVAVGVALTANTSNRLVYQRPRDAEARAISIMPAVGRSGARVLMGVTW